MQRMQRVVRILVLGFSVVLREGISSNVSSLYVM